MAIATSQLLPLSGDALVDASLNGSYWITSSSDPIYWSISDGFNGEYWTDPVEVIEKVDLALSTFSYYANLNFEYVGYFQTQLGQITMVAI